MKKKERRKKNTLYFSKYTHAMGVSLKKQSEHHLSTSQWSPAFLAPGTSCVEDSFSPDGGLEVVWGDTTTLHPLHTLLLLLLYQLHLTSSGTGSRKLGTCDS